MVLQRRLKDIVYKDAVPTFARCNQCGHPFYASAGALDNHEKSTRDFYAAFEKHSCAEDASQSAARIVREATEDH
jgi:hypothetical protein